MTFIGNGVSVAIPVNEWEAIKKELKQISK
jgi:hypothetical protein